MCKRYKSCETLATFRVHPPPVHISCTNLYGTWLDDVFKGIMEYFAPNFSPDPEDFTSVGLYQADTNKFVWLWPRKHKEFNVGVLVQHILKEGMGDPSGELTVALKCAKGKITCPTCGHVKVNKDGRGYTD